MTIRYILFSLLVYPLFAYSVILTEIEEKAKQQGIIAFNQYSSSAIFFESAAKAGDAEAQYYFAKTSKHRNTCDGKMIYYWYEQSAQQGYLYAMIQLSRSVDHCDKYKTCTLTPDEWKEKAQQILLTNIDQGDSESMGLMYEITHRRSWAEKAAEAGNAYYQYELARFHLDPSQFESREEYNEAYRKLMEQSAKGGYVPAMYKYSMALVKQDNIAEAQYWMLKAVEGGYIDAVRHYSFIIFVKQTNKASNFQFPLDQIKGYALLSLVGDIGGAYADQARSILNEVKNDLTPEQVAQANVLAEDWKKTHPPLSSFADKLSIL